MRWSLALFALVAVVVVAVGASTRAANPAATCMLPGTPVPCLSDSECAAYDAICDVQAAACVCPPGDLGSADLAGVDFSTGGDGGGGSGGGSGGAVPPAGGGMTSPPKSSGCSFAPGSR
jgi:hypothetical protein